ncbi:MAG: hypothetical protein JNL01_08780 [Bdellovibrionales bacterium]|nr:hypothetical protein [Bdellovibrionales bacterium]
MILPSLIRIQFKSPKSWIPPLWIPIFLIWPILLLLSVPVLLFALFSWSKFGPVIVQTYRFMCELRGTLVDVESPEAKVLISIH